LKLPPEVAGEKDGEEEGKAYESSGSSGSGKNGSGSEESSDEEPQDETMGNIDEAALEALKKRTADVKDEDDDDK